MAMDLPVEMPLAAGAADVQIVPLDVNTFPAVPAAVNPVPPAVAGTVFHPITWTTLALSL